MIRQVLDTTDLAPTDGFTIQGDARGDTLGSSVSGAGDINGDGFDDLIAGADNSGNGQAYIVYGGTHLGEVVSHAQTLADREFLLGGAGDDVLTADAATKVLYGGAGDDTLELVDASFRRVDGGSGDDTLGLGSGVTLDLTAAAARGRIPRHRGGLVVGRHGGGDVGFSGGVCVGGVSGQWRRSDRPRRGVAPPKGRLGNDGDLVGPVVVDGPR